MIDGGTVFLESGIAYEEIRKLVKMGHKIQYAVGAYAAYQAIRRDFVIRGCIKVRQNHEKMDRLRDIKSSRR